MSYESLEDSKQDGIPVSLYLIEYDDTGKAYFAYTDMDENILHEGINYTPISIGREKIEASGGLDNTTLEIATVPQAGIIQMFQDGLPTQSIRMTIRQGHYEDDDYKVVWTGRVMGVTKTSKHGKIACEPISTQLRRAGLRRNYQYGCPWALYGKECGVTRVALEVTPAAVGLNYVDLAAAWHGANNASDYVAGYVQWLDTTNYTTQTRTILKLGANDQQLIFGGHKIRGLDTSGTLSIFLGCNHQEDQCTALHNNILNYGGQTLIPVKNPTVRRHSIW